MSDVLTSSLSAALAVTPRLLEVPAVTPPAAPENPDEPTNLNAPAYINPSITFDPETSIVVITYRDADGKVREQIPPPEVIDRYREVDQTGMQSTSLPRNTPMALAAVDTTPDKSQPPPAPPASNQGSGSGSGSGSGQGSGTIA
jgi:hypothetical protein